jgi:hypothetical protein
MTSAETLAEQIRISPNIYGIKLFNEELKISQMADDTVCFCEDNNSVIETVNIFNIFTACSGLKSNKDKN